MNIQEQIREKYHITKQRCDEIGLQLAEIPLEKFNCPATELYEMVIEELNITSENEVKLLKLVVHTMTNSILN